MTCKQWPANCFLVKTCRFSCFVLQRTCQCFVPCSWPEALETFGNARLVQRPKARMSLRYAKQIGHANLKSENMFITCFLLFFKNHILPFHTYHIYPYLTIIAWRCRCEADIELGPKREPRQTLGFHEADFPICSLQGSCVLCAFRHGRGTSGGFF